MAASTCREVVFARILHSPHAIGQALAYCSRAARWDRRALPVLLTLQVLACSPKSQQPIGGVSADSSTSRRIDANTQGSVPEFRDRPHSITMHPA